MQQTIFATVALAVVIVGLSESTYCVYRKPKPGRSGDEVRQGSRVK